MDVAMHLPDDIAQRIARLLTTEDVRRLLGFDTKIEVHAFFKAHDVPFYTLADLEHERDTSWKLGLSCW